MAMEGSKRPSYKDDGDEDLEETYYERLVGLTEMFPEPLIKVVNSTASFSKSGIKWLYGASREITWIVISSAIIGLMPYNLDSTRQEMIESQKAQDKSILLGPNVGMTGQNTNVAVPMPMLPSNQTPK